MAEGRGITIHDVASKAGVAVSSVSRALSNHPDVSRRMQVKVQEAAKELGYFPDPVAQSLRRGSTRTVGFVVRDLANPFFSEIIHGAEQALTDAGYTLLVMNSGGDAAREVERIGLLRERRVDALVLSSISEKAAATRKAVSQFKNPVVLLDRDLGKVRAGSLLLDHASGVRAATTDLLQLGHRRIALVTGTTDIRPTRERLRGYEAAHDQQGSPTYKELEMTGVFSAVFARETVLRLLSLPRTRRPSAIVAGGIQCTVGVLEAFSELRIRAGEDISLVVCDDLPWLRVLGPAISVVRRDGDAMGRAAAEMALSLIGGGEPRAQILPTQYERRDTSLALGRGRVRAVSS